MAQANVTARFYAYISGSWVLLDDVSPAEVSWGISGNSPIDRLADTGELSFALNNSGGLYSPDGPSVLSGWGRGVPLKLVFSYDNEDYIRFKGVVSDIQIRPNN